MEGVGEWGEKNDGPTRDMNRCGRRKDEGGEGMPIFSQTADKKEEQRMDGQIKRGVLYDGRPAGRRMEGCESNVLY
jgi:hypothetical protein